MKNTANIMCTDFIHKTKYFRNQSKNHNTMLITDANKNVYKRAKLFPFK